jgi:putative ABC transport system permease protein
MYAVVKERTREIGVKMALGAKARWITWPFVLEGLVYTLVGGTAGILGAIGLLAGYFPARRAAAIDPAATLRYE